MKNKKVKVQFFALLLQTFYIPHYHQVNISISLTYTYKFQQYWSLPDNRINKHLFHHIILSRQLTL